MKYMRGTQWPLIITLLRASINTQILWLGSLTSCTPSAVPFEEGDGAVKFPSLSHPPDQTMSLSCLWILTRRGLWLRSHILGVNIKAAGRVISSRHDTRHKKKPPPRKPCDYQVMEKLCNPYDPATVMGSFKLKKWPLGVLFHWHLNAIDTLLPHYC